MFSSLSRDEEDEFSYTTKLNLLESPKINQKLKKLPDEIFLEIMKYYVYSFPFYSFISPVAITSKETCIRVAKQKKVNRKKLKKMKVKNFFGKFSRKVQLFVKHFQINESKQLTRTPLSLTGLFVDGEGYIASYPSSENKTLFRFLAKTKNLGCLKMSYYTLKDFSEYNERVLKNIKVVFLRLNETNLTDVGKFMSKHCPKLQELNLHDVSFEKWNITHYSEPNDLPELKKFRMVCGYRWRRKEGIDQEEIKSIFNKHIVCKNVETIVMKNCFCLKNGEECRKILFETHKKLKRLFIQHMKQGKKLYSEYDIVNVNLSL